MRHVALALWLTAASAGCGAPSPGCANIGTEQAPDWRVYCPNDHEWQPGDGAWYPLCADEDASEPLATPPAVAAYCNGEEIVCPHAVFRCVWVDGD